MLLLQALQGGQCLRYAAQTSLVGGDQVQGVAVLGRSSREHLGRGERFRVPATPAQLTDAAHLAFDREYDGKFDRRGRGWAWHGSRL